MQGIEAGGDLHALHIIHGLPIRKIESCRLQRRTAVGESVLNDQVFALLRVDEGRDIGVLRGNHRIQALEPVRPEQSFHGGVGPGRNLVNHGPREGNLRRITDPGQEAFVLPAFREDPHGLEQLFSVMGTVVRGDHRDGSSAGLIPGIEQGSHLAEIAPGLFRTGGQIRRDGRHDFPCRIPDDIPLLRNGKRGHLQRRIFKHLFQMPEFRLIIAVQHTGFSDGTDHRFFHRAIGFQRDQQRIIIVGPIAFLHDFIIKALHRNDPGLRLPGIQQFLHRGTLESAENIPGAEMHPNGRFFRCGDHFRPVEPGKKVPFFQPFLPVFQPFFR